VHIKFYNQGAETRYLVSGLQVIYITKYCITLDSKHS